jgi:integrase
MTVFRRDQRWVAKVWQSGEWRWIGTFATKREARRAEQQAKPVKLGSNATVAEFCDRWLRDYARPSPSTQRSYRYAVQAFKAEFGRRRLDAIDRPEARAWVQRHPQSNARVVRAMYADAMRDGLVAANPFAGLRLQKPRGRKDLTALTEVQIDELADAALEALDPEVAPAMRAMILVAGYCGLRPGELFALEWSDLGGDELTVARSIDSTGQPKLPKNGKPRTILMPPKARHALAELPRRVDVPWVFTTSKGRRFTKSSLRYHFTPVRSAWGSPNLDFYELRHACATLLLERGASPMDVAQHLGHSDHGRLVQELYGHPEEAGSRERLRRVFGENVAGLRSVTGHSKAEGERE